MQKSFVATGCYSYINEKAEREFKDYDGKSTFHGTLSEAAKNADHWQWQHSVVDDVVENYDEFNEDDSDSEHDNI